MCARGNAWYVDNSQSQSTGRAEQIKITERIEVAEVTPSCANTQFPEN